MSEKIIKNQEETKEETKIGSEEIVKNEGKEVPEKVEPYEEMMKKMKKIDAATADFAINLPVNPREGGRAI